MTMLSPCGAAIFGWVLGLMIALQPRAAWRDTYDKTACVVATMATAKPLNLPKEKVERTAVLLVSLAWWESRFNPEAYNPKDPGGGSYGLFQASRVPVASVEADTANALEMVRKSFSSCAGLPTDKLLSWYTSGGPVCFPTRESTHRMQLALKLLKEHPAP